MLILTLNEWLFNKSNNTVITNRTVSLYTELSLEGALTKLKLYQYAYNARYGLVLNFSLISVSTVTEVSEGNLDFFKVGTIEDMPTTVEDFDL